jgi:hypothetical protein
MYVHVSPAALPALTGVGMVRGAECARRLYGTLCTICGSRQLLPCYAAPSSMAAYDSSDVSSATDIDGQRVLQPIAGPDLAGKVLLGQILSWGCV